ncbi:MAG: ABC-F family ATP-binding cassette domain-containing protein [Chthoniobacteraceae bacterium]
MSSAAALLSAKDIRLAFGYQKLLDGATLAVAPGEKVGLVGRNGCGKTSLLRILAGENEADGGEISRRRGLRIGYLPQKFELEATKTVEENIRGGAADLTEWLRRYEEGEGSEADLAKLHHDIEVAEGWTFDTRIQAITGAIGAPSLSASMHSLSGGEKRRVALCRALVGQPDLLLLDEPTNHLDAESIRWLENFLRTFPGAAIFITHDRYFLDVIATRIIELADGRCFSHAGNYTNYLEDKAVRQHVAEQSERRRQRFIRAELEFVRAGVRAQRSKSRLRLDTFYDVAGLEAPPEEREMDLLIPPAPDLGNIAVEIEKAGACVGEESARRWLFRGLTFSVRPGQCTGIVGRNGAGKTTLLRLCLGERKPDEGTVAIGKRVVANYVDQARMQLDGAGTVMTEVEDSDGIVNFGGQPLGVRPYLRRFLFSDERINDRVDLLSGGERARLMLAKVLKRGGNVLVLDEPTNDLDLGSLRMLEEAVAHYSGCVLVVSHDRYFLDRVCDQIVAFEEDGVFVQPGNYSYYLEKKLERDTVAERAFAPVRITQSREPAGRSLRPRKLTFKERHELDQMEEAILLAEAKVTELEVTLNDPDFYSSRAAEAETLVADLERARTTVAELYARWQELEKIGN